MKERFPDGPAVIFWNHNVFWCLALFAILLDPASQSRYRRELLESSRFYFCASSFQNSAIQHIQLFVARCTHHASKDFRDSDALSR